MYSRTESKEELSHVNIADQGNELRRLREKRMARLETLPPPPKAMTALKSGEKMEEVDDRKFMNEQEESGEEFNEESQSDVSTRHADSIAQAADKKAKQKTGVRPAALSAESSFRNSHMGPTPTPNPLPIPPYSQPSPWQPQPTNSQPMYLAGQTTGIHSDYLYTLPIPPATNFNCFNRAKIAGTVEICDTTMAESEPSFLKTSNPLLTFSVLSSCPLHPHDQR